MEFFQSVNFNFASNYKCTFAVKAKGLCNIHKNRFTFCECWVLLTSYLCFVYHHYRKKTKKQKKTGNYSGKFSNFT